MQWIVVTVALGSLITAETGRAATISCAGGIGAAVAVDVDTVASTLRYAVGGVTVAAGRYVLGEQGGDLAFILPAAGPPSGCPVEVRLAVAASVLRSADPVAATFGAGGVGSGCGSEPAVSTLRCRGPMAGAPPAPVNPDAAP